ncbi:MAG: putative Ig domain-containing protein, partial [Mycoplasmataceae bacterium]|nr:putative Ig domain-containing protein [Mycoplasmataceae bacterium]
NHTYSSIDNIIYNFIKNNSDRFDNFYKNLYFKYTRYIHSHSSSIIFKDNDDFNKYYGLLHMITTHPTSPIDTTTNKRKFPTNSPPVYRSLHIPEGYYSADGLVNYINNNSEYHYTQGGVDSYSYTQFLAKVVDNDIVIYTTDGTDFFINPICHLNKYQETNFASEHRLCAVNEGYEINTEYLYGETINIQPYFTHSLSNFSATGLPTGLNINADGSISGSPTSTGTFEITVTAYDANNNEYIFTLPEITIISNTFYYNDYCNATHNTSQEVTLNPIIDYGSFSDFSVVEGTLPTGLNIDNDGLISGTIYYSTVGDCVDTTVTIEATSNNSNKVRSNVNIFVNFLYVNYANQTIEVGKSFTIQPTDLRGNYTSFDVISDLSLNYNSSTGYITGSVDTVGTYDVTVKLTDERDQTYTMTFTVEIYQPTSLSYTDLSDCTSNTSYTVNIEPTIEGTISNFSVVEGVIPTGLNLNEDGSITGTINYSTVTNKYIDTTLRIKGETSTGYIYATINIYINFLFIEYNFVLDATSAEHNGSFHKGDTFTMYPVNKRGYFTSKTFSGDTNDFTFTFDNDSFNAIVKDNATTGIHNVKLTIKDDRNFTYTASFQFTTFAHPTLEISDGYFITNMFNELTPTFTHPSEYSSINFSATGLPSTLSIDSLTGVISGTPTSSGIYNVTVTFTSKLNEHHTCEYNTVSKTIVIKVTNEDDLISLNTLYCCQYYESSQIKVNVGEDVTITSVDGPLPIGIEFYYDSNSFCYVSRSVDNYPIDIEYEYGSQTYTRSYTLKSVDALQNIGGWSVNLGCPFKFNIGFNMSNWSIISAKIYNIDNVYIDTDGYIYGVIDKLTTYYPIIELICRDENGFDHKLIKYITIVSKESDSTPFNYFNITNRYRFQSKKQIN